MTNDGTGTAVVPDVFDAYAAGRVDARFTDWLRERAEPDWTAATTHRFARELGGGVLEDEVFRRYLVQDYAFIEALVGAFGHAVGEAPSMAAKSCLVDFLGVLTADEDDYFERSFDALDVQPETYDNPDLTPATRAFTDLLEFAPEVERDGTLLGGRLDRFTTIPDDAWHGILDAHAPRTAGESKAEAAALAADNAARAARLLDAAPDDPAAVFVNDATIPLQAEVITPHRLVAYCEQAPCAVLNEYEGESLGTDDPVSRRERLALAELRKRVDQTISLPSATRG